MSIKKMLILSNIAMIVVPILLFLLIEMASAFVFFYILDLRMEGAGLKLFSTIQVTGLLFAVTVSNGVITYLVSKRILEPVRMLTQAAKEISQGNLEFSPVPAGKDEIGELTSIFERMRGKLLEAKELQEKYEENRKELIANISHDLRTPMTSLKGYARGILDGVAQTPEKIEHYAQIIYTNATTMEKMIDELFLYSKLDLNQVPMVLEEVDLQRYFADYLEELGFALEQAGVRITYSYQPGDSFVVLVDRDQLRRVLENVFQNSLKYMNKVVKEIQVRLVSEPSRVRIEIEDNGPGIAEESLPYIFDRFYRADAARSSSTGGSGLGMAIAKQIIEAHGGRIGASSVAGKGTTISFILNKPRGGGGPSICQEY